MHASLGCVVIVVLIVALNDSSLQPAYLADCAYGESQVPSASRISSSFGSLLFVLVLPAIEVGDVARYDR